MKKVLFFLFPLLVLIFLLHYALVGQAVYGDGIYYWSFARSVFIDHDINVGNEILHYYDHQFNNSNKEIVYPKQLVESRNKDYKLPIGVSVAWLPFFAVAQGIGLVLQYIHIPVVLNGYSDLYQVIVGIGNILFMLLGLYYSWKLVRQYYYAHIAIVTVVFLFFASNLFYYGSIDVVNSHPLTFFLSSFTLYFFFGYVRSRWYQWIGLGMLIGGLALTRNQDVLFGVLIPAGLIHSFYVTNAVSFKKIFSHVWLGVLSLLGMLLFISPQLLLLQYAFGSFLKIPYLGGAGFNFLHAHLLGLLINSQTGLLWTSPIVVIGFIGLVILAFQKKYIGIVGSLIFLTEYVLIASWASWNQASSYGIRMLISTYPLIAVGLGFIIQQIVQKYSFKIIYFIGVCLIIINFAMILRFHLSVKNVTIDNGKSTRVEAQQKVNSLFHTHFRFFKN